MAVTYHELNLNTRRALRDMGVEASQLEAQELICAAAGKTKEEFLRDLSIYTTEEIAAAVERLVERRKNGEPIAYLMGEWEFYGLTFAVSPQVLIPRVDTEVLARRTIALLKNERQPLRVLDLCAGTGCVGISVAHYAKNTRAVLVELSDGALQLCKQNIRRHGLTSRVFAVAGDALGEPAPKLGRFELLVCNPPYIPTGDIPGLDPAVRDFEPHLALDGGADGLDFYRAVIGHWSSVLKPGGRLLFEVGIRQAEAVARMLQRAGYENILITADTAGIDRVVEGSKKEDEMSQEEP